MEKKVNKKPLKKYYFFRGFPIDKKIAKYILSQSKYARTYLEKHNACQIIQEDSIAWKLEVVRRHTKHNVVDYLQEEEVLSEVKITEIIWEAEEVTIKWEGSKQSMRPMRVISVTYKLLNDILSGTIKI